MNNETGHLKILSVFHFVLAGFFVIYLILPIVYFAMGCLMLSEGFSSEMFGAYGYSNYAPDMDQFMMAYFRAMSVLFVVFSAIWFCFAAAFIVCMILAGVNLLKKRHYYYCMVMAAIATLIPVFGTLLGVFTIIELCKPEVKAAFLQKAPPAIPIPIPS